MEEYRFPMPHTKFQSILQMVFLKIQIRNLKPENAGTFSVSHFAAFSDVGIGMALMDESVT